MGFFQETPSKYLGVAEGFSSAYERTSTMIMFCHVVMMLEIVHAALGLVKGGVVSTFLQASGNTVRSDLDSVKKH